MVARDGADVAPEAVELVRVQALAVVEQLRDDVLAEVVLGGLVNGVLAKGGQEQVGRKDVDAHGGEV